MPSSEVWCARRSTRPPSMVTTATHDTKRGQDARMRLALLSEMPREWGRRVAQWLRLNRSRRSEVEDEVVPDRNVEYLFYQTLLGAFLGRVPVEECTADGSRFRVSGWRLDALLPGDAVGKAFHRRRRWTTSSVAVHCNAE